MAISFYKRKEEEKELGLWCFSLEIYTNFIIVQLKGTGVHLVEIRIEQVCI